MPERDSIYHRFLAAAAKTILQWGLEQCDNDRTRAAKLLGLSRAGFYKLLRQHDLLDSGAEPPEKDEEEPDDFEP